MLFALVSAVSVWVYWDSLVVYEDLWRNTEDYSHGYIVPVISLIMLIARRDRYPGASHVPGLGGLALLGVALLLRYVGEKLFLTPVPGYSMICWLAGSVWILGGRRMLWWALPSLVFLLFALPLPFSVDRFFSVPLRDLSTAISTWMLQLLGQPAMAMGNTIDLPNCSLDVEDACSGLRMMMGVIAFAFAYGVIAGCARWQQVLLLILAAPIAVLANSLRIVSTGIMFQYATDETAQHFAHDIAGWTVIPVAGAIMIGLIFLFNRVFVECEPMRSPDAIVRRH